MGEFDKLYFNLNKVNLKSIYTTNIDNLIPKIIEGNTSQRFLHNQKDYGPATDKNGINYLTLHGNIEEVDSKFIFSSTNLANIYNDANRIWNYLSLSIETYPTLFIGYSLNDTSTIQALTSRNTFKPAQKDRWIVIRKEEEDEADYYRSLGFNIIISDTRELLKWIGDNVKPQSNKGKKGTLRLLFPKNLVPESIKGDDAIRPINVFFRGASPWWSDIQGNAIYRTSYCGMVQDSIFNKKKHTIIIGAPATGKTTVMMQVAYTIQFHGVKLLFNNLTCSFVDYLGKVAGGEPALIFVENFSDDMDAFLNLCKYKNFKVVGVDRGHNFGQVSHLIDENVFDIINITDLNSIDIQGIYDSLPADLRKGTIKVEQNKKYHQDSIFEFVIRNINMSNIKERYAEVLRKLDNKQPDLAEFLVLCAYAHNCRVPLSSEMAYSYFNDVYDINGVFDLRRQLGDLLSDYDSSELADYFEDMDYYYPRSFYIAESIINGAPRELLKRVMENVIIMIPPIQICNYHVFKRYAFDCDIVSRAFANWHEGQKFYEDAFLYDYQNPYVLQQGALYLCSKHQYALASAWIDRALNMTNNRKFSIRNTHAIILFRTNIDIEGDKVRPILEKSMSILAQCYRDDMRKAFHAIMYARQSIEFYKRFPDDQAKQYLETAQQWIKEVEGTSYMRDDIRKIKDDLKDIMLP